MATNTAEHSEGPRRKTTIQLRRRLLQKVKDLAKERDRSVSYIIQRLVERGLEAEQAAAEEVA